MRVGREERQQELLAMLTREPFLTDAELADRLAVSVGTIRLDRHVLHIPEVRQRMRMAAGEVADDPVLPIGEVLEMRPRKSAISVLTVTSALLRGERYVPAQVLYGIAAKLAEAVLDLSAGLCGVGNIKYKAPVAAGDRLLIKLSVVRTRASENYVWVKMARDSAEVFRTKFIMKSWEEGTS